MSPMALTVMIAVCGFVWGGFVVLLTKALRSEGAKKQGAKQKDG